MTDNNNHHTPRNNNPPPAPTRNRAVATRLSLDGPDNGSSFDTSSAAAVARSPAIGGLLRFSPHPTGTHGTTGLSPYNRGRNNRTRFFGSTATSTAKSTSQQQAAPSVPGMNSVGHPNNNNTIDLDTSSLDSKTETQTRKTTTDDSTQSANDNTNNTNILDGMHLDYLRTLAEHALLESPAEATFYAGLLYSKTRAPTYALLLAQAYNQAHQHSSCLRLLEESNIIQSQMCEFWTQGLLLACSSLAAQGEWAALVEILEDACRLEPKSSNNTSSAQYNDPLTSFRQVRASTALTRPLEDDDDFGWETLKESISVQQQQQRLPASHSEPSIHPLARLCVWRGRAYYETGHVLRAAVYWKRALRMDSRAVEAWQLLLEHALVTPTEGHDLLQTLEFAPHHEWLKALYMTRIELSTALPASMMTKSKQQQQQQNEQQSSKDDAVMQDGDENHLNGSNGNVNSNSNNSSLLGNNSSMDKSGAPFSFRGTDFDASSISISSPILPSNHFAATPGNTSMMDNSVTGKNKTLSQVDAKKALVDANVNAAFVKIRDVYKLQNSPQVLAMFAKRAYRQYQWKDVLDYCEQLAEMDPTLQTGGGAAYVYVAALLICGRKRTLFSLAHNWVEGSPKSAQAWFAVGAYYSCCGRHHIAQRHFCRATRLDPQCTEAWIAFGCSFAACDESDQALASFRAAQRLSPGEHTSLLYMGMEYNRTNHLVLAQNFLNTALQNSGGDPLCWHELGVLASNKGDYKESIDCFGKVLSIIVGASSADVAGNIEQNVEQCTDPYWEATIFNLGHAFRKFRHYEQAATCYLRCIALCPDKCSGYSAYAFACQLMGDSSKAVEYYHQALSCKPDDNFATEMLGRALNNYTSSGNAAASTEKNDTSLDNPTAHRLSFPVATPVGTMPET